MMFTKVVRTIPCSSGLFNDNNFVFFLDFWAAVSMVSSKLHRMGFLYIYSQYKCVPPFVNTAVSFIKFLLVFHDLFPEFSPILARGNVQITNAAAIDLHARRILQKLLQILPLVRQKFLFFLHFFLVLPKPCVLCTYCVHACINRMGTYNV